MECATLFSGPSSFGSKPEPAGVKIKETRRLNGSKIFRKCRIDAAEERLDLVRPGSEDFRNPMQDVCTGARGKQSSLGAPSSPYVG